MRYSMVKLPDRPMMPRLFDERVGYFTIQQMDYGVDEQRAPKRTYITRWRLEKKDPTAELSEPIKPIVYYVDPATPADFQFEVARLFFSLPAVAEWADELRKDTSSGAEP